MMGIMRRVSKATGNGIATIVGLPEAMGAYGLHGAIGTTEAVGLV